MSKSIPVLIYPRGFMSLSEKTSQSFLPGNELEIAFSDADPVIQELYSLFISRSVNYDSWRFRKLVIAAASRLLGDVKSWITLQAGFDDYVYGLNFDFLQDTWGFIKTGHRDMSPLVWQELLLEHQEPKFRIANPDRVTGFKWDGIDADNVIGQWCSHDGGFEDMLSSLHVLFGKAREPLPQKLNP